jgi:hypothetical protein
MTIEITYNSNHPLKPGDLFAYNTNKVFVEIYKFGSTQEKIIDEMNIRVEQDNIILYLGAVKRPVYTYDAIIIEDKLYCALPRRYPGIACAVNRCYNKLA